MPKEKMNRCKNQIRWRKTYKKHDLCVTPADLGGLGYDDTIVAANRWLSKEIERINAEIALKKRQPLAEIYRSEQQEMEVAIKVLSRIKDDDPVAGELIETMKIKCRNLQRTSQDEETSAPGLSLLNPLRISTKQLEKETEKEEVEKMFMQLLGEYIGSKGIQGWCKSNGYHDHRDYDGCDVYNLEWDIGIRMGIYPNPSDGRVSKTMQDLCLARFSIEKELECENPDLISVLDTETPISSMPEAIDRANVWMIRKQARETFHRKNKTFEKKIALSGALDDFERGRIVQQMHDLGATLPETKQLSHYIERYLEDTFQRQLRGEIRPSRKAKICCSLDYYYKWTKIGNVAHIVSKSHLKEYFDFVCHNVFQRKEGDKEKISDTYGRDLLTDLYQFIAWLAYEEEVVRFPDFLQGKNRKRYMVKVGKKRIKTVTISDMRKILDNASHTLKLCVMLTLNCGFGQAEIGRLQKYEYDPKAGRIRHVRKKIEDKKNAPEVSYLLWPETKVLLDKQIALQEKSCQKIPEFSDYLLLNRDGHPLWQEKSPDAKKYSRIDNIKSQLWRLLRKLREQGVEIKISYYQFRKLPPSIMREKGQQFNNVYRLWLGHCEGVSEDNYAGNGETTLDRCVKWLYGQLFGDKVDALKKIEEIDERVVDEQEE